jgi:hypothetical protein
MNPDAILKALAGDEPDATVARKLNAAGVPSGLTASRNGQRMGG